MRGTFTNRNNALHRQRRIAGWVMLLTAWLAILWFLSPGIPVLWGPWASAATKEAGRGLFEHEWTANDPLAHGDGLGPVYNAKACVACHFQGGVGGAGDSAHNVHNYEALPTARDAQLHSGTVHAAATDPALKESFDLVRRRFPVVKGGIRVQDGCSYKVSDFDPVRAATVQPTALFGAGWIDRISPKAITSSHMTQMVKNTVKELDLDFSAIPPGKVRHLPDGRVGKFGWKAQFATLEEFVAAACANELGLGTPVAEQVKPFARPDAAAVPADLDKTQFKQLVAFVDTLPKPVEAVPDDPAGRTAAARGKEVFGAVGCALCHVPDMGGVKGVYSDFLLHAIDDPRSGGGYGPEAQPDVPVPDDVPKANEWRTPPLWGVADSAPYLHDGSARTLRDAITRHGGDAKAVTQAFEKLPKADQDAVLAFLRTLKAPPDAMPVGKAVAMTGKR
ncbi:MAG TPA: di-heme oxidoredictase family protein [Gemmataceae bacterium]|jgi:mono/diheme cytochrome c family protein